MASSDFHSTPQFPYHTSPRTWLIISGLSATGLRLARTLLAHGDNVVLGTPPATFDEVSLSNPAALNTPFRRHESELLRQFLLQDIPLQPSPDPSSPPSRPSASPYPSVDSSADWHTRFHPVRLDPRAIAQCQGAVAQTVRFFGSIDVLVCNSSEVLIGTVEELAERPETRSLLREQFEVNFFANVNAIKAALPAMRRQAGKAAAAAAAAAAATTNLTATNTGQTGGVGNGAGGGGGGGGHIVVVTGITSHLGTPGLGGFCASGWALEGYCDSIAYEIAPFNIKLSIIQPHLETAVLPTRIKAAPLLPQYSPSTHPAPLARNSIGSLLDRIHNLSPNPNPSSPSNPSSPANNNATTSQRRDSSTTNETDKDTPTGSGRPVPRSLGSKTDVVVQEPRIPEELADALVEETLFSICAIGGHPNPPQRHIVGTEAVVSVKEKLKTVSIELEDLVGTSAAVDLEGFGEGE